jgi:hypothetical protein
MGDINIMECTRLWGRSWSYNTSKLACNSYNDGHIKGLLSGTACPKMYLGKLQQPRTNLTIKLSIYDFGIAPGSMGNT